MRRAILLDALGTTVRLQPPWEAIDPDAVAGLEAPLVRSAFEAEMRFYASHADEAVDLERLAALRGRCAKLLSSELGRPVDVETMMAAIRFEAYPDARPAMEELRRLGLRLVCVSNWDCALAEVLERVGLAGDFDAVVVSALVGARKPAAPIFTAALEAAGCGPAEALHVGDSDDDVDGARAAGIEVLRIDRSGGADIASLGEIVDHLGG